MPTSTPRKRANPRRTTAAKPADAITEAGSPQAASAAPFVLEATPSTEDKREPLFSIGGTVYSIPVDVPAVVGLEYTMTMVEQGTLAALAFALTYALGADGRRALMAHRGLTDAQFTGIVDVIRAKFDGSMTGPKGAPSSD